jgi:hypothetical protein
MSVAAWCAAQVGWLCVWFVLMRGCKRCEGMGMPSTKRRRRCCEADRIQKTETSDGSTSSPASHPRNESAVENKVCVVVVGEGRAELGVGEGDLDLAAVPACSEGSCPTAQQSRQEAARGRKDVQGKAMQEKPVTWRLLEPYTTLAHQWISLSASDSLNATPPTAPPCPCSHASTYSPMRTHPEGSRQHKRDSPANNKPHHARSACILPPRQDYTRKRTYITLIFTALRLGVRHQYYIARESVRRPRT